MNKWVYGFLVGVILLVLSLRGLDWLARRGNTLPVLPKPNAYDELLAIAGQVKLPDSDLSELSAARIKDIARENSQALKPIHPLLEAETSVPLKTDRGWDDQHAADLKSFKRLSIALGLNSRAHYLEGRTNDAASSHLDIVLLGQSIGRGGLLVDRITALTIETLGAASLRADVPHMDAAACSSFARQLEKAESRREPPEQMWETEKCWANARFGVVSRVAGLLSRGGDAKRRAEFAKRSNQTIRRTRRVMLALAGRAFELETGKPPVDPSKLVPVYLAAIPLDPVAGLPFSEVPQTAAEE